MKNTKLVRFLMLFTVEEFKKLGLFVRSPYYNRLNNVIKLYNSIKKYYPDFDSRGFTKENVLRCKYNILILKKEILIHISRVENLINFDQF